MALQTEYAVIRALDSNTEFVACHSKKVTCMVTLKGEAEVEAQGEVVVVSAGESAYVFPGQPPQPPICAQMPDLLRWMDQKRGVTDIIPLGALVAQWPQRVCSAEASSPAPTVQAAVLPLADGMSRIERGRYLVGVPQPDDFHIPWKLVELSTFWIDEHEVTNAQYGIFLEETDQLPPVSWVGGTFPSGKADHPVSGIGWEEAAAFCIWANKLLPTEAQWEVAARGPGEDPPLYPWGADPQAGGDVNKLPLNATYEVGTKPFNRSAFDVYDMSGNVWEWVREPYSQVPDGHKVVRGGRHGLLKDMAYRQLAEPNDARFVIFAGLRCATEAVADG
ncbi:MAG: formylglycine-generating enzyme family protein [Dehalococcoidia bacterium]